MRILTYIISHRFQVITDYWSNLGFRPGEVLVFNTLVRDESISSEPRNLAPNKLETSLYYMVLIQSYWQMIISFCHKARGWQTDRQKGDGTGSHFWSNLGTT